MGTRQTLKDFHPPSGNPAADYIYQWSAKLLAAGAVLKGSSNGTTADLTGAVNKWTNAAAIDNANKPWIRLLFPDGSEHCIQYNGSTGVRWKYSHAAGFIGGSPGATQVPSAADEGLVLPATASAGTDAAPQFKAILSQAVNLTVQGYFDLSISPAAWYMCAYPNGGGLLVSGWSSDPVQNAETGEVDFQVFYGSGQNVFKVAEFSDPSDTNNTGAAGHCIGWLYFERALDKGFVSIPAMDPRNGTGSYVNNGVTSARTGKDTSMMIQYQRRSDMPAPNGWKGSSTLFRWAGQTRNPAQNGQVAAASDREYMGDVIAVWDSAAGAWT